MENNRWQRLNDLFARATNMAPDEQARFLQEACGDDSDLLRDLRQLLANDTDNPQLTQAVGQLATDLVPGQSQSGDVLGSYELLRNIGSGGMGTIWLARRSDNAYDAEVAIKLMHGIADDVQRSRFLAERQILATLNHPHIASLIDGGTTDSGVPYVVMEYVDGERIDYYCEHHSLDIESRLALFCDLCDAVQYAHGNLVVHRDIKPSNVLVTADGTVKLLDFGIAKLTSAAANARMHARETIDGSSVLTPVYSSPEQIRGQTISTASDTYSLGVLLFELLTGRLPYDSAETDHGRLVQAICEDEPRRASGSVLPANDSDIAQRQAELTRRRLVGDIDNILNKALAKQPQDRYASVNDFGKDIRRHLEMRPVHARPASHYYRLQRFVARNRRSVSVSVVLIIALLGATVFAMQQMRSLAAAEAVAQQERELTRSEVLRSTLATAGSLIARADPAVAKQLLDDIDTHERGWEWRYLMSQLDHSDAIDLRDSVALTYTQDNTLLSLTQSGELQWWQGDTVVASRLLTDGEFKAPSFDSNGKRLTLHTAAGFVETWSIGAPGTAERTFRVSMDSPPVAMALAADRSAIAVAYPDHLLYIDTESGQQHQWSLPERPETVAIDNAGQSILVQFEPGRDEFFRLYNAQGTTLAATSSAGMSAVALAPNGTHTATADSAGTIRLRDARAARVLKRYSGHRRPPTQLRFSADGRWLFSSGSDFTVRSWPVYNDEPSQVLTGITSNPLTLAAAPSGSAIAAITDDHSVQQFSRIQPAAETTLAGRWAVLMDDVTIAALDAYGTLRLIDTATLEVYDKTTVANLRPDAFAAQPGAGQLYAASGHELFAIQTNDLKQSALARTDSPITKLAVSQNGSLLAASLDNDSVMLFETQQLQNGKPQEALLIPVNGTVHDIAFSADEQLLAIAGSDGVDVHAVTGGALLSSYRSNDLAAHATEFSNQDSRIATGWSDGTVRIFDFDSPDPAMTIVANAGAVTALAYSADGKRLASGDATGETWLSNTVTGRPVFRLSSSGTTAVEHLAFSDDNLQLFASTAAARLSIWDTRPMQVRNEAARDFASVRTALRAQAEAELLATPNVQSILQELRIDPQLSERERRASLLLALDPPLPTIGLEADPFDGFAMRINGGDEHVLVSNAERLRMRQRFTVETWFRPLPFAADDTPLSLRMLFNKEGEYQLAIDPRGRLSWTLASANGWLGWVDTRYTVPHGSWAHVAIVRDMNEVRVYLNGHLVQQQIVPATIGDQHPYKNELRIGGRQHTPSSFYGDIDNLRIWSVARTEQQIRSTMLENPAADAMGLLAAWAFDTSENDMAIELTGQHPGQLIGSEFVATHRGVSSSN